MFRVKRRRPVVYVTTRRPPVNRYPLHLFLMDVILTFVFLGFWPLWPLYKFLKYGHR